jgi:hypothetical protein
MRAQGFFGEGEIVAPPRAVALVLAMPATGFVLCPPALMAAFWADRGVHEIYRLAYEQARAALRPSWYERLSRPTCN